MVKSDRVMRLTFGQLSVSCHRTEASALEHLDTTTRRWEMAMTTGSIVPPADERAARFEVLVNELCPMLRRANPFLSDDLVLETAVHIAAYRLSGGDMVAAFIE
jgi:hypothetical protein